MSLLKIPLLISAHHAYYRITTPPNARPHEDERAKAPSEATQFWVGISWLVQVNVAPSNPVTDSSRLKQRALFLIFSCEALAILAALYPSALPFATSLTSVLTRTPSATYDDSNTSSPSSSSPFRVTSTFLIGYFLTILGASIRLLCYHILGRRFTFDLAVRDEHRLVTTFPYSIVRHPAYFGALCGFTGMAICVCAPGSFLSHWAGWDTSADDVGFAGWVACICGVAFVLWQAAIWGWLVIRLKPEEMMLKKEFGKEWEEYKARVRWRMIPGVY